jgi:hypothetical protein
MRKLLLPLLLLIGFPLVGSAQVVPRVDVFGGYTYVHAKFNNNGPTFNLNGWDASVEGRMASWLGVVADVSQQYGTPSGIQEKQTTALFGPQISAPGIPRVIPFAHALFGVAHGTNQAIPSGSSFSILTGNAFATAVGGGVDIKILGPLWVRPIQADWLHSNLNPDHRTDVRLAAGIVIRL